MQNIRKYKLKLGERSRREAELQSARQDGIAVVEMRYQYVLREKTNKKNM